MASDAAKPPADLQADVLIVGAGPAGSATALALMRAGVPRVALLDRPVHGTLRVGESAAPNVAALLGRLGLTVDLAALGHRPCHGNLSLWGGPEPVVDDFLHRGTGHGWHLDRAAFDAWLRDAAVAAGARLVAPATLEAAERSPAGGWRVRYRHGGRAHEARAGVLVDASGRKAALATRLGARRRRLDGLVALAAVADPAPGGGLPGLSLVEAAADGWWYAACLPSGRAMVTFMTDDDLARTGRLRDPGAYLRAWRATGRLRELVPPPAAGTLAVTSVDAASQYADRAVGAGWMAVGDALIGFDPLTASGIAGALEDAIAAADTIMRWFTAADGARAAEAARAYAHRAESTLRRYLAQRRLHYGAERRWAAGPFWSRRAEVPVPA